jgi:malate dehydrogenase (quinone)
MAVRTVDVILVGGGVMSATLGTLLRQLDPSLKIVLVEKLDHVAHESTNGWNNAGTGHSGYCELNYTPEVANGNIDISKALSINASFEVTLQLWSSLVELGVLPTPSRFINRAPHESFVWGEKDVAFLKKRHALMSAHHLFKDMSYSEDPAVLEQWMPLVVHGRDPMQPVAATRVEHGSDVDFGSLTRSMIKTLRKGANFELLLSHPVISLRKRKSGKWRVVVKDEHTGVEKKIDAGFVFLGAGGAALPLLQKSGIPEADGYGGFPVSGQWLVCKKPEIVRQHNCKVYGKAPLGAPPMSVPHLDTRIISGQQALLFGPYAGFTTKFLKKGSVFDLFTSISKENLRPIMAVGMGNMDLTKYLIAESLQSHEDRVKALRNFFPEAQEDDWELQVAGQRVQIIKKYGKGSGRLEFGTEIVSSADGTLAALLGASPGASTAVQAMIDVIERCFARQLTDADWKAGLKKLIPSYGESLIDKPELLSQVRSRTLSVLGLKPAQT